MTSRNISFLKNPSSSNDAQAHAYVQNSKTVECQLRMTYARLAETEANLFLFSKLQALGMATNDVANFVKKQTIHRKANHTPDLKVQKAAMRSKMTDALAYAKRLRQQRDTLKKRIQRKYSSRKCAGKKLLEQELKQYQKHKEN